MTKSRPQVEVEGFDYWVPQPMVDTEWAFRRPGMSGDCRCVWSDQTGILARHPECPVHPPFEEVGYWGSQTISVSDQYL